MSNYLEKTGFISSTDFNSTMTWLLTNKSRRILLQGKKICEIREICVPKKHRCKAIRKEISERKK